MHPAALSNASNEWDATVGEHGFEKFCVFFRGQNYRLPSIDPDSQAVTKAELG